MPVDYTLAKIYKIEPLNPDDEADIYIGSTCEPTLAHRMASHRRDYSKWKNRKYHWISSFKLFEKYGVNNCNIILIEDYSCNNKDQLRQREGYYIKSMPCVNKNIAGQTKKECLKKYYEAHKDTIKERSKQYYEAHKDTIKENKNTNFMCICKGCYTRSHKSHHYKTKIHINYMRKHDAVIEEVNQILESINELKLI